MALLYINIPVAKPVSCIGIQKKFFLEPMLFLKDYFYPFKKIGNFQHE